MVFIHGLGADGRCFRGALEAPDFERQALLIPDLAGFGHSPAPSNFSFAMQAHAELLGDLCQTLGISEIAIGAHSMGGAVGIHLAEMWPGKVTHFINAVGNLIPEDCFYSRSLVEMSWEDFSTKGFAEFKTRIAAQAPHPNRPPSTYLESLQKSTAEAMYYSCRDLVRLSDSGDLLSRFLRLSCRKIYLQDSDSRMPSHLEEALHHGHVPIVIIPESGHALMEDNPDDFYDAIARFVSEK
jgi:pimeloyl-ACP methyl ester carboxylesterase